MSAPRKPQLAGSQRLQVERARKTAAASAEELAMPGTAPDDLSTIYAQAFGYARGTVGELLAIIDDLTGGAR